MFPAAPLLAVHQQRKEGGRSKGGIQGLSGLSNSHEVFGISQIKPAHRHKPAGAAFCCGEPIVSSCSSPVLNHAYTLQQLSPALLRMPSTSQPSVQQSDSHLLHAASSLILFPELLCRGRLCFVLLNVHTGRDRAGSLAPSTGVKGGDYGSPTRQLHHDCRGVSRG